MNIPTRPEAPLPRNSGPKTQRVDLGLAVLSSLAPPRAAFTTADIAAWCACTPALISNIEARALRRMREKIRVQFNLSRAEMESFRRFFDSHLQS